MEDATAGRRKQMSPNGSKSSDRFRDLVTSRIVFCSLTRSAWYEWRVTDAVRESCRLGRLKPVKPTWMWRVGLSRRTRGRAREIGDALYAERLNRFWA